MASSGNSSVDNLVGAMHYALSGKSLENSVSSAISRAKSWLTSPKSSPAPAPKPDTSWHDDMVDKANASFSHPSQPAPKPSGKPVLKYHKGTDYVPETGPAILKKGEAVLNNEDAEKYRRNKMSTGHSEGHPAHKMEDVHLSKHRVVMHLHKGGLHRALHIPEDQTIPEDRIEEAKNSKNPHVREMANLAHTMEGWHHK